MNPRLNTEDLVRRIESLARERMGKGGVVNLDDVRRLKARPAARGVLLIEDDDTVRAALKRVLENDGYRVSAAADGSELARVLDGAPIDLILLDVGLPWINGFELARMMKAHAQLKDLPLVFLSARTDEADVKRGFEVGADDYIKKPFEIDQVRRTVKTLIQLAHGR